MLIFRRVVVGVRVAVGEHILQSFVSMLNCKGVIFPFTYLGIPVGGNPCKVEVWGSIIANIKKKLSL